MQESNCHYPAKIEDAQWFRCILDERDFRDLLVYDGGEPLSLWQKFSNGSYELPKVVQGIISYREDDQNLSFQKAKVLEYEERIEASGPNFMLCLVRYLDGPLTLFDSNRRAAAYYLHCFVYKKSKFQPVEAIVAVVKEKLQIQYR